MVISEANYKQHKDMIHGLHHCSIKYVIMSSIGPHLTDTVIVDVQQILHPLDHYGLFEIILTGHQVKGEGKQIVLNKNIDITLVRGISVHYRS